MGPKIVNLLKLCSNDVDNVSSLLFDLKLDFFYTTDFNKKFNLQEKKMR